MKTRLAWQSSLNGDKAPCEDFRDDVLGAAELCVFGWMKKGSPFVQVIHSVARYSGIGGAAELRGHVIGFLGDRDIFGNQPHPVKLQKKNAWEWLQYDTATSWTDMAAFFANPANRDKGWAPDGSLAKTQGRIPRMLYLPMWLAVYCLEGQRTPYELLRRIGGELAKQNCGLTMQDFKMVQDWGVLASQRNSQSNSLLVLDMEPVTSVDPTFGKWRQTRLDGTLGVEQAVLTPPPVHQQVVQQGLQGQDLAQMLAAVGTRMGATMAESLKPMAEAQTKAILEKRRVATEGKQYDGADLARIKAWSNVYSVRDIQPVWREFQLTKDTDTHRESLWKGMLLWSSTYGYEIDKSIYYGKGTMEDIVALRMITGGHVPDLSSAEKGNSFLSSVFRSTADTKAARESDKAEIAAGDNITLTERLRLLSSEGRPPPRNFLQFKRAVATYAAKQWTLWGDRCPFYKGLVDIRNIMELGSCQAQQDEYKPLLCRQYSWAIMVDCQAYFTQTVSRNEFARAAASGSIINFPISSLTSLRDNVLHGSNVYRLSFPKAWISQPDRGRGDGRTSGTQGEYQGAGAWRPPDTSGRDGRRSGQSNGGRPGNGGGGDYGGNRNNRNQGNGGWNDYSGGRNNSNQGNGGGSGASNHYGGNENGATNGNGQRGWARGNTTTGQQQRQGQNNGQGGQRENYGHMHPTIKRMMDPFLQKFQGQVRLREILEAANVGVGQLPTINGITEGSRTRLCYQGLLGKCQHQARGNCQFAHAARQDVPNDFADEVCRVLGPGVDYMVRNGRPPPGREDEQNRQGGGRNVRGRQ